MAVVAVPTVSVAVAGEAIAVVAAVAVEEAVAVAVIALTVSKCFLCECVILLLGFFFIVAKKLLGCISF